MFSQLTQSLAAAGATESEKVPEIPISDVDPDFDTILQDETGELEALAASMEDMSQRIFQLEMAMLSVESHGAHPGSVSLMASLGLLSSSALTTSLSTESISSSSLDLLGEKALEDLFNSVHENLAGWARVSLLSLARWTAAVKTDFSLSERRLANIGKKIRSNATAGSDNAKAYVKAHSYQVATAAMAAITSCTAAISGMWDRGVPSTAAGAVVWAKNAAKAIESVKIPGVKFKVEAGSPLSLPALPNNVAVAVQTFPSPAIAVETSSLPPSSGKTVETLGYTADKAASLAESTAAAILVCQRDLQGLFSRMMRDVSAAGKNIATAGSNSSANTATQASASRMIWRYVRFVFRAIWQIVKLGIMNCISFVARNVNAVRVALTTPQRDPVTAAG